MPVPIKLSENSSHSSLFLVLFKQYINKERQRRREIAQYAVKRRSRKVPIPYTSTSYNLTIYNILLRPV
jgi:hypothetical protein